MNEDQQKEAIALLHRARRLIHTRSNSSTAEAEAKLVWLADSESFMAEGLGIKPEYDHSRHWTREKAGPGELERTGYLDQTQGVITDEIDLEQESKHP